MVPLARWREGARNAFVVFATAVSVLGSAGLVALVSAEHVVQSRVQALLGELVFTVDSYGMLFSAFTSLLWFSATLYSVEYLRHEHKRDRFHVASLVVLSAMLGVVLAGDLITLYLFFEVLGLVAFLLVIHTETPEARSAGIKYLWMTVVGGFALVGGIFLIYALGGSGALEPLPPDVGSEPLRWAAFGLLVLGFGVKAGMVPVHVWLPDAHPVAPTPASALLSGVMIKAGAYGIFRVATALFRPPVALAGEEALWHASSSFGLVIIWLGIATMVIGVVMALGQHNAKRMLAYHSVSQMGFILAGIGAAAYLGTHGALGIAGGLYHVVNHALFKGALFLGVGAVAYRTGELNMYKLGGLWRRMPLTFVFTLIAALGITGVPLFNGFVSKCLIHHALVEAYEFHHLLSLGIAEKIYILTCGGTACSFIKLIGLVFLGKAKRTYDADVVDPPWRMLAPMGLLGVFIVALGVRPDLLLDGVFAPGLHTWGLHSELLTHYLEHSFMSPADLMSVVIAFAIGAMLFVVGMRFGLFHLHAPEWVGVNHWYVAGATGLVRACGAVQCTYEQAVAATPRIVGPAFHRGVQAVRHVYQWGSDVALRTWRGVRGHVRTAWRRADRRWHRLIAGLVTGSPELRDRRFIESARLLFLGEQRQAVRAAVGLALSQLENDHVGAELTPEALVATVRGNAQHIAGALSSHRIEVLQGLALHDGIDDIRESFAGVVAESPVGPEAIAAEALALSLATLDGSGADEDLASATSGILREEAFAQRLSESARPARRLTVAQWRDTGASRTEFVVGWTADILRILAEASTQEHTEWMSGRVDAATVMEIRRDIQRYARDMSINVAVIVMMLLVIIASIAAAR